MKKVLIVVDMQNDFISGALGSSQAKEIIPNVGNKIKKYIANNNEVIFTKDTHSNNYLQTLEGKNLPIPHCEEETWGWEICDELIPYANKTNSKLKNTFGDVDLSSCIDKDVELIEIVGLCTGICVITNALILKTMFSEIPIVVDSSCCACVSKESHKIAISAMKMCQIEVINDEN